MENETKKMYEVNESHINKILNPVHGHALIFQSDAFWDWNENMIINCFEEGLLNPDTYYKKNESREFVPVVPFEDIERVRNVDPNFGFTYIHSQHFFTTRTEPYENEFWVLLLEDERFDITLTTFEKRNLVVEVFNTITNGGDEDIITIKDVATFKDILVWDKEKYNG